MMINTKNIEIEITKAHLALGNAFVSRDVGAFESAARKMAQLHRIAGSLNACACIGEAFNQTIEQLSATFDQLAGNPDEEALYRVMMQINNPGKTQGHNQQETPK